MSPWLRAIPHDTTRFPQAACWPEHRWRRASDREDPRQEFPQSLERPLRITRSIVGSGDRRKTGLGSGVITPSGSAQWILRSPLWAYLGAWSWVQVTVQIERAPVLLRGISSLPRACVPYCALGQSFDLFCGAGHARWYRGSIPPWCPVVLGRPSLTHSGRTGCHAGNRRPKGQSLRRFSVTLHTARRSGLPKWPVCVLFSGEFWDRMRARYCV